MTLTDGPVALTPLTLTTGVAPTAPAGVTAFWIAANVDLTCALVDAAAQFAALDGTSVRSFCSPAVTSQASTKSPSTTFIRNVESAAAGSAAPPPVMLPPAADCDADGAGPGVDEEAVPLLAAFCCLPGLENAATQHAMAAPAVIPMPTMAMDFIITIPSLLPADPR